ncbi:ABC transporter permease [Hydrocarboniclastica marina]|uniref:ABC transporter permease n=1 Tax=Hydrocarboniclastica marina TaxID=2259620 RepID=A0A4P7XG77_9ALTE|nr:ABC transporter permease [Hydrocarboniclastica marina]MAL99209.1 ABC transporter permease [Alteromonadaceae bacterium]QCF25956.1 ABC transporter permease [Hydrocarboniclastica marina]|tara:strand:+ start:493 stop:1374 length:882 start_codon:yes stop_codon:yes gene_type:complete
MSVQPKPAPAATATPAKPVLMPTQKPAATTPSRRYLPRNLDRWLVRGGAIVFAVLMWQLLSSTGFNFFINFEHVPTPVVVGAQFAELVVNPDFYVHIYHSLVRIFMGYALAAVIGITLGVVMGRSRFAEDVILPYIEILRPIPAVAWIPLAILMMPSEQASIVYITFLGAVFPIVLNTVHGVEQTPPVLIRAARSLGASNASIMRHVVLPGALPSISAGLAIGMGVAWFSLLAGEIISGQYGIGYFTWSAYTLIEYPKIIIGMLVIGLLGSACTWLVRLACSPLLRWQSQGSR